MTFGFISNSSSAQCVTLFADGYRFFCNPYLTGVNSLFLPSHYTFQDVQEQDRRIGIAVLGADDCISSRRNLQCALNFRTCSQFTPPKASVLCKEMCDDFFSCSAKLEQTDNGDLCRDKTLFADNTNDKTVACMSTPVTSNAFKTRKSRSFILRLIALQVIALGVCLFSSSSR